MAQEEELRSPHRLIARRIRELRQRRGWSAQRLAAEMTAAGVSWDRPRVANIETGRRSYITVEEALALARVLGVGLVHLIIPPDWPEERPYPVTPAEHQLTLDVRGWVRGQVPLSGQDERQFFAEVPVEEYAAAVEAYTAARRVDASHPDPTSGRPRSEG